MLIDFRVDVNAKDKKYNTALIYASIDGRLGILEKLIKHGAKVNYRTDDGWCAFMYACWYKHEKVIRVLLQKYNTDTSIKYDGKTGLQWL